MEPELLAILNRSQDNFEQQFHRALLGGSGLRVLECHGLGPR